MSEGASGLMTSVFAACDLLSADLFAAELEGWIGLAPLGTEELWAAAGAGDGAFVVDAGCDGVVAGCDVDARCVIGGAADVASA